MEVSAAPEQSESNPEKKKPMQNVFENERLMHNQDKPLKYS